MPHDGRALTDARPFRARRERLAQRLGGAPALVPSGGDRGRNYPANTFPFRASSHFLYLFGLPLRDAWGHFDGTRWTLHIAPEAPDAALWHGAGASLDDLSRTLDCPVAPLDALTAALAGRAPATIPSFDPALREAQARLLGRTIDRSAPTAADLALIDAMIALRLCHDDDAIAELRAGAAATAAAHAAGMRATRPGITEATVRAAMEAELCARGMGTAYGSIVTVHGEVLHNDRHHHVLGAQDLVLADVGAETPGGWASDVTRTWPVSGHFSPSQRDLYEVVLRAQEATIRAVRPGVRYRDLHLLAARHLAEGLVALGVLRGDPDELVADGVVYLLFPHGIGHLLGLDVHDMEDLGDRAGYGPGRLRAQEFGLRYLRLDRDLLPGMAVTIEPGLYLVPAILGDPTLGARAGDRLDRARLAQVADVRGIRIEDDVLVTDTGHEVLTAAIPRAAAAVEAAVQQG
jgi:Xaa-Pro aminopeptidase